MSREENLPPELKSLEAALASLVPRADRLDRDRLLFEAGRASVAGPADAARPRIARLAWPAAFATMTAAAAVLGVMVAMQPGPEIVERVVYVPAKTPAVEEPSRGPSDREEVVPDRTTPQPPAPIAPPQESLPPLLAGWPERGDWLSLRRSAVDVASLDRALAARGPERNEERPAGNDGSAESYRAMLDRLLAERSRGG